MGNLPTTATHSHQFYPSGQLWICPISGLIISVTVADVGDEPIGKTY